MDWLTVDGTSTFTYVRVTACSDAEIILSSSAGVHYGHRILIGKDGVRTVILSADSEEPVDTKLINPLHCGEGNTFGFIHNSMFVIDWSADSFKLTAVSA